MDHQLEMATSERELLDSIIQQLFGVGLRLEACLRIAEDEQTARTEILDGAISRLGDLVECLRSRIEAMEV
jgi:signal transduction histidine kinase